MKKPAEYFPIVATLISIILVELILLRFPHNAAISNQDYAKTALSNIRNKTPKVFEYIREKLPNIIKEGGISRTIQLTKEAFQQEAITMYQCHTLAHNIGHYSKLNISDNFSVLTKIGVDFCEGGFKHGLEAEIALQGLRNGTEFRPELYNLCVQLLKISKSGDCYHGAGHEFMRETMDAKKALALCDTLTGGPVKNITNCYNGVFSEYTNLIGAVDGETGYRLPSAPLKLNNTSMDFCASLESQYQIPCALELNGYGFGTNSTQTDLEKSLNNCIDKRYKKALQVACIHSVSAVFYQHQLPKSNTIIIPDYILPWPDDFRKAYISGAGTEMAQFLKNGVSKDWSRFCKSFSQDDYDFCVGFFR